MAQLVVDDVLLLIFNELRDDLVSLHSCVLVNTIWCHIAVPLLWKYFSDEYENPFNYKRELRKKFYNVVAHFLPSNPGDPLPQNNIELPLNKFPKKPTFEYMNFLTRLTTIWIKDMAQLSINDEVEDSAYKKKILEQEIFKLIFNRCNNVKYFHWNTRKKLYQYPNAKSFFSNLRSLEFNFDVANSKTLFKLADLCKNITNLEIIDCNKDTLGLVSFIKTQENLQSLSLDFDEVEVDYTLLSNVITKKAATLKKFIIQSTVALISPIFVPSLKNIQYLALDNEYGQLFESAKMREWEYYISMASFPYVQYLETSYLPNNITCLIIENSGKNIIDIDIRYPIESNNYQNENKKLINALSSYCPKLINLIMDVDHRNLSEMRMFFSNCMQLKKIFFTTNANISPNGDELLRIMSEVLSNTLLEFSFGDKLNFSLTGLESFFENLKSKNRSPIKFVHHYDRWAYTWTSDHDEVLEKYKKEGVIR